MLVAKSLKQACKPFMVGFSQIANFVELCSKIASSTSFHLHVCEEGLAGAPPRSSILTRPMRISEIAPSELAMSATATGPFGTRAPLRSPKTNADDEPVTSYPFPSSLAGGSPGHGSLPGSQLCRERTVLGCRGLLLGQQVLELR